MQICLNSVRRPAKRRSSSSRSRSRSPAKPRAKARSRSRSPTKLKSYVISERAIARMITSARQCVG